MHFANEDTEFLRAGKEREVRKSAQELMKEDQGSEPRIVLSLINDFSNTPMLWARFCLLFLPAEAYSPPAEVLDTISIYGTDCN